MSTPTPAQIVNRRERLGLSQTELARLLDVEPRAVRRWEAGEREMSERYQRELDNIELIIADQVERHVTRLRALDIGSRYLTVFRTQADQDTVRPEAAMPASLGRAIARIVQSRVTHVTVEFWMP